MARLLFLPTWRRYLTIEPVTFFYAYGLIMSLPIWQQYVYHAVSDQKGFPYENLTQGDQRGQCSAENFGPNSTLKRQEQEVQRVAAGIDLGHTLFSALPSLLVAPFWGPWTDKAGRKHGMIVPAVGAMIESAVVLLIMYFRWPLWVMFIGGAINGFSGFLTTITLSVMAYIADTTEKENRAFRLAVIQLLVLMGGMVSQVTSGLWIEKYGFIVPTYFILVCALLSGVCSIFLVPETRQRDKNARIRFFNLGSIKECVRVLKQPREGGGRWNLLLLLLCSGILTLTTLGLSGVVTLFVLRTPLCWSPTVVGYFMAYRFFVQGVGAAVGIKALGRCLREVNVARVGMLTQIAGLTLFAFADRTWLVFLVPIVGLFNGTSDPIMLGIMSRIVSPDEQGVLFCVYGIVNTISQFIGAMVFNGVYQRTLHLSFGFVFILSAVLVLIPLALISFIKIAPMVEDLKMELEEDENQNAPEGEPSCPSDVDIELKSTEGDPLAPKL